MSDQQTAAASSPAEVDVFNGEQPTLTEWNQYRQTGEVPARFKSAETVETATTDQPEETVSASASESETDEDKQQEPPQKGKKHATADDRKAQLRATIERLWEQDEPDTIKIAQLEATIDKIEAGQKRKTEPAPVNPVRPQAQQSQPQEFTRPKPVIDGNGPDGKPYTSYEDYVDDLARWNGEQMLAQYRREQAQQAELSAVKAKLDEARTRYDDADEIIFPAAQAINDAHIPQAVKEVFAQSEHFTDLCYVVGSDPDELKKFIALAQSNPRAALAKVFEYERGIIEELGKPAEKAPEKKTTAPKPPSPVNGGSSRTFDVSDESLSAEEWMRKRNQELARRKA